MSHCICYVKFKIDWIWHKINCMNIIYEYIICEYTRSCYTRKHVVYLFYN